MTDYRNEVEEVKLVYRNKVKAVDRPKVRGAARAHEILIDNWDLDQIELREEFKLMFIDRGSRLMSIASLSQGGMSGTVVDPKLAFTMALKRKASSIIMAHNHPSGSVEPSKQDIRLTKKFTEVGRMLELPILDHIILTENTFYSMAEEGLI